MKAKLFKTEKKSQIFLSNGDVYTSKKNETVEKLTARVKKIVEEDLLDTLELKEVTIKSLSSLKSATIVKTYPTAAGLFQQFLGEILTSRKVALPTDNPEKTPQKEKPTAKADVKADAKADAKAAKKVEPKTLDERQIAIKEFKNSKEYVMALKNVGKEITYTAKAHKKEQKGTVKGLSINKKLTKFYYTVVNASSKKRECVAEQNAKF